MTKCPPVLAAIVLCLASTARAETPRYTKHVQPFLKTYCVECHNANRAKARINLESYEAMMKAARKGRKIVVAGDPDKSRLLHTLEGKAKQMPPRKYAHQPTDKEVAMLRQWIAAGARLDKEGETSSEGLSRQDLFDDFAMHVRQSAVAAVVAEGQLGVIDPQ